jgi:hypothetical protein
LGAIELLGCWRESAKLNHSMQDFPFVKRGIHIPDNISNNSTDCRQKSDFYFDIP